MSYYITNKAIMMAIIQMRQPKNEEQPSARKLKKASSSLAPQPKRLKRT